MSGGGGGQFMSGYPKYMPRYYGYSMGSYGGGGRVGIGGGSSFGGGIFGILIFCKCLCYLDNLITRLFSISWYVLLKVNKDTFIEVVWP